MITTLVMALLVGLVVSALLFVAQQQNYMTSRAQVWSSEIPIAEAGIEEAMALLNSRPPTLAQDGWTKQGTDFVKTRTLTNSYYYTVITPIGFTATNRIVSIGFARVPLATNYTQRTVRALAKLGPPGWGIVTKTTFEMNGNPYVDSYDSSDPRYSTNGMYDPTKRRDRAGVASTSGLTPAIDTNGGEIYGSAGTGPGGTVDGDVGSGAWLSSNSGQQPDRVYNDFNMAIPDATLPANFSPSAFPPLPGIVNGVTYVYKITAGDWQFDSNVSLSSQKIYVEGKVRIYFRRDLKMTSSASITLATNATVEIYLGGDMDLSGDCVINPTGIPNNCAVFGLPGCKEIKYAGNAQAFIKLYAPNADIRLTGDFDFCGSMVGNSIRTSGNSAIHYDEALRNGAPDYVVVEWEEL